MRNIRPGPGIAVAAMLIASSASMAAGFEPKLSNADLLAAEKAGFESAAGHNGFPVSMYTVFARPDALTIAPGDGSVDAIIVGTPYERVSYASYVAAFQGHAPTATDLQGAATPYSIDVVVVGHSAGKDADEQNFLTKYSGPILDVRGFGTLRPISKSIFGPTIDFYNLANKSHVLRWLGYNAYRFDLRPLTKRGSDIAGLKATLRITDPYGRSYTEPVDLSKFR
ncbi:MAG TPA: hypothetical protein VII69_07155 [Candidatus Eremiobacteraceae bacterium]